MKQVKLKNCDYRDGEASASEDRLDQLKYRYHIRQYKEPERIGIFYECGNPFSSLPTSDIESTNCILYTQLNGPAESLNHISGLVTCEVLKEPVVEVKNKEQWRWSPRGICVISNGHNRKLCLKRKMICTKCLLDYIGTAAIWLPDPRKVILEKYNGINFC